MVVMMFLTTLAFAQNANLQVNRIMDGKIVPLDRMVVTKVRGRALSRYKLCYYRSTHRGDGGGKGGLCAHAVNADKGGGRGKCREPGKRKPARDFSGEGPRGLGLRGTEEFRLLFFLFFFSSFIF